MKYKKITILFLVLLCCTLVFISCKSKKGEESSKSPKVQCCGSDPSKCCGKAAVEKAHDHLHEAKKAVTKCCGSDPSKCCAKKAAEAVKKCCGSDPSKCCGKAVIEKLTQ